MLFPFKGRKCWILIDCWEEHAAVKGIVTKTKQGKTASAKGCIGWDICGSRKCRGVEVEIDGAQTVEYICDKRSIYATRRAAERAARAQNKSRSAGML